jgi:dTDP-4-amino-4,6-dideoxygalactose transaminase
MSASFTAGWLEPMPPLSLGRLLRSPAPLPFPFDDPRCRLYDLGRNALWHGLKALGVGPGDELLMPAYHCGTEVGPTVDLGIVPRFWGGTPALDPDEAELESLLTPRTRGLYLIHHLGFPQDSPRWRRWCDERNLLLLEDVAPAWPGAVAGTPLGSWGDLSIFSQWKVTGLPEGAAVLCDPPPPALSPTVRWPLKGVVKAALRWPEQRSSLGIRRQPEPALAGTEPDFSLKEPERGVSAVCLALGRRLWRPGVAVARRRNYQFLSERLSASMPEPFRRPLGETCPQGLPVATEDKLGFMRHLAARGVGGVDFWSVPHPALARDAFTAVERRRATTVLLPVHQGLRRRDLERIATAAGEWSEDRR